MSVEIDINRSHSIVRKYQHRGSQLLRWREFMEISGTDRGPKRLDLTDIESADPTTVVPRILQLGRARLRAKRYIEGVASWQSRVTPLVAELSQLNELEKVSKLLPPAAYQLARERLETSINQKLNVAKPAKPAVESKPAIAPAPIVSPAESSPQAEKPGQPLKVLFVESGLPAEFGVDLLFTEAFMAKLTGVQRDILKTLVTHGAQNLTAVQIAKEALNENNSNKADISHRFASLAKIVNSLAGKEVFTKKVSANSTTYTADTKIDGLQIGGQLIHLDYRGRALLKLWPFSEKHKVSYDELVSFVRNGQVNDENRRWVRADLARTKSLIESLGYQLAKDKQNNYWVEKASVLITLPPHIELPDEPFEDEFAAALAGLAELDTAIPEGNQLQNLLTDEVAGMLSHILLTKDGTKIIFKDQKEFDFVVDNPDINKALVNLRNRFLEQGSATSSLSAKEVIRVKKECIKAVEQIMVANETEFGEFVNSLGKDQEDKFFLVYLLRDTQVLSGMIFSRFLEDSVEREVTVEPVTKRGTYVVTDVHKVWYAPVDFAQSIRDQMPALPVGELPVGDKEIEKLITATQNLPKPAVEPEVVQSVDPYRRLRKLDSQIVKKVEDWAAQVVALPLSENITGGAINGTLPSLKGVDFDSAREKGFVWVGDSSSGRELFSLDDIVGLLVYKGSNRGRNYNRLHVGELQKLITTKIAEARVGAKAEKEKKAVTHVYQGK